MVRVMLCGDLRGRLPQLCENVRKLHAKLDKAQHFQAIFCVGEFSVEDTKSILGFNGDKAATDAAAWPEPPAPVYFIDAGPATGALVDEAPQGREVRPGLHFLGHFGVTRVAGLSVAYLSGRYKRDFFGEGGGPLAVDSAATDPDADASGPGPSWEELREREKKAEEGRKELFTDGCYTPLAVERLREEIVESGGVDLLLTSEWPSGCLRGVTKEARAGLDGHLIRQNSSLAVAEIAQVAEPRYHAVGLSGAFWRRPPWRHEHRGEIVPATGEMRCGVCRLVALGSVLPTPAAPSKPAEGGPSPSKPPGGPAKWLHGLELDPNAMPTPAEDSTANPFSQKAKPPEGASGAGEAKANEVEFWNPAFGPPADKEERRRWLKRFGATPAEMSAVSDKIVKEDTPKEKTKKRQSLYPTEKDNKKKRGGFGDHQGFKERERHFSRNQHM